MKHVLPAITLVLSLLLANSVVAQTGDLFTVNYGGQLNRFNGTTGERVYGVFPGPHLIMIAKQGNVLYITTHDGNSVIKVDPETGDPMGTFASGGGLSYAAGLTFGPDGNLYVGSQGKGAVLRYDGTTGAFIDEFVPSGGGGLRDTEALIFGPDGNLYVTEKNSNRVLRYDGVTGDPLGVFATDSRLENGRAMLFGALDGNLYVSGNQSDNIVRFDGTTGAFIDIFAMGIRGGNGMVVGPDGNIYVAAEFADKVMKFDAVTGDFLGDFASNPGLGPIGIFFDL